MHQPIARRRHPCRCFPAPSAGGEHCSHVCFGCEAHGGSVVGDAAIARLAWCCCCWPEEERAASSSCAPQGDWIPGCRKSEERVDCACRRDRACLAAGDLFCPASRRRGCRSGTASLLRSCPRALLPSASPPHHCTALHLTSPRTAPLSLLIPPIPPGDPLPRPPVDADCCCYGQPCLRAIGQSRPLACSASPSPSPTSRGLRTRRRCSASS